MSVNNEVELKGGMYTFMSLKPHTTDLGVIDSRLGDKVQQAPGFFKDTPVVVDLSAIELKLVENSSGSDGADMSAFDMNALLDCIRQHKLVPIVASVADKTTAFAGGIDLPLIESGSARQTAGSSSKKSARDDAGKSGANDGNGDNKAVSLHQKVAAGDDDTIGDNANGDSAPADLPTAKQIDVVVKAPMLLKRPVRSGQQVYSRETDLIIMGQVGAGAEVLADQNIHVYGPLRGRALCGVSGNTSTRIFCQSLEAELVSVAGNYRVLEEIPTELRGKPAQIWLDKDRLNIEPLVEANLSGVIA